MPASMRKYVFSLGLALSLLPFAGSTVFATNNTCNLQCQVDNDCASGYACYVGICRNKSCPSDSTCGCTYSVTPTPTATPAAMTIVVATPTPSPRATQSAVVKVATRSANRTPKTGPAENITLAALGLFAGGIAIAYIDFAKNRS